jgi:hypothetical protein
MTTLEDAVGAQAKFAVFVASPLQRHGVTQMAEMAELLDLFAQSVAESEPGEAGHSGATSGH